MRLPKLLRSVLLLATVLPGVESAHAWPHSPTANVYVSPIGFAYNPQVAPDGAGGFFVAYADYRNGNADIVVQHHDSAGNPLWAANGVVVCNQNATQNPAGLVADGAGGLVVLWSDYRSDASSGDLFAARVNASGLPVWAVNGVAVGVAASLQYNPKIVSDRTGGAFIVWDDYRAFATNNRDVYAQHITGAGALAMPVGGLALAALPSDEGDPDLAVNEFGEALIAWTDTRAGTDIYGQYLSYSGIPNWAATGAPICNAVGPQANPRVELLPNGRFMIAWEDARGGLGNDLYAQVVTGFSGAPLLVANGVPFCTVNGEQLIVDLVADGFGGYVVMWMDLRNGVPELYAQKLNGTAVTQWPGAGMPVLTTGTYYFNGKLAADGMGGVLASWADLRSDFNDIYAQRLRPDGTPAWKLNGVGVCTASGVQSAPVLAPLANGGVLLAWDDNRPGATGARMQAVDEWGYLGAEPVMADVRDIPNDQGGQVKVTWAASPLDYDAAFRNITNYTVFRSVPQRLVSGLFVAGRAGEQGEVTTADGRKFRRQRFAAQDYYWEELARITARHVTAYSFVAATEGDSISGSNPVTVYMIGAETENGTSFWFSAPDSGYSVDNLPPAAPAPLTGQYSAGATRLHWNPNTEADIAGYRLYRGTTLGFTPSAGNLVAALADTGHVDAAGAPYIYKLTAIDSHGNESPVATLQPAGILDAPGAGAARAYFALQGPNPLRAGQLTQLRFGLALAGHVRVALHDTQGRVVRVLADGPCEPGEHHLAFDGRDASGAVLAPGLYLARIDAPGLNAAQRLVVIQ